MDEVLILAGTVVMLVAALAAGLALGLNLAVPRWSVGKRSLIAAGIAAGAPMSIAIGGLFTEVAMLWSGEASGFLLGLLALVVTTLVLAAALGLPMAWLVARKVDGTGPSLSGSSDGALLPEAEDREPADARLPA